MNPESSGFQTAYQRGGGGGSKPWPIFLVGLVNARTCAPHQSRRSLLSVLGVYFLGVQQ